MTTTLDLTFLKAPAIALPVYDEISLMLIGCGGTGSWLAPSVARIARILSAERHLAVHTIFYDGDIVEAANISRQHFCQAEIGRNKAECLAVRYGLAWGIDILAMPAAFTAGPNPHAGDGLQLFIGCVDNAAARTAIARQLSGPDRQGHANTRWWLDCGNDYASGQVTLGCAREPKALAGAFALPGKCLYAPAPSLIHPNLLVPLPEELSESPLSCEQIALANLQGLAINQQVAAVATSYLVQLLLTGTLKTYATHFDQSAGSMTSDYLSPVNFERVAAAWQAARPKKKRRVAHKPRRYAAYTTPKRKPTAKKGTQHARRRNPDRRSRAAAKPAAVR